MFGWTIAFAITLAAVVVLVAVVLVVARKRAPRGGNRDRFKSDRDTDHS